MKGSGRLALWLTLLPLLLLIATAIFFSVMIGQSRTEMEQYRDGLEKRGEKLTIEELEPPAPPEEGNGATDLREAARDLSDALKNKAVMFAIPGEYETRPGYAEIIHRRSAAVRLSKDVDWETVTADLQPLRPFLERFRAAAASEILEMQPNYRQSLAAPLNYLNQIVKTTQFLGQENMLLLREGRPALAIDNVTAILRVSQMLARQKLLISQLISLSMIGLGQVSTWEILQSDHVTAADLQRLQAVWQKLQPAAAAGESLRMERAMALPYFDEDSGAATSAYGIGSLASDLPKTPDEIRSAAEFFLWRLAFRYSDERHFLENFQKILDAVDTAQANQDWRPAFKAVRQVRQSLQEGGLSRNLSRMVMTTIDSNLRRFPAGESLKNLTLAAIAIKRYQLDHEGRLPRTLDELVPAYLDRVPIDPADGKPLRYKPEDGAFLLYAIGSDETDNGGNASKPAGGKTARMLVDRLDIVWPKADSAK